MDSRQAPGVQVPRRPTAHRRHRDAEQQHAKVQAAQEQEGRQGGQGCHRSGQHPGRRRGAISGDVRGVAGGGQVGHAVPAVRHAHRSRAAGRGRHPAVPRGRCPARRGQGDRG